ncbi:MAG: riboflavin synthase [Gammaproteobacteria bacterium]|nr:riboflavin synthase [Gammaproteobacteria bacterium]
MFTGIVESIGRIAGIERRGGDHRLRVAAQDGYLHRLHEGDSVAVSGICLTAMRPDDDGFFADVSVETLLLTTAGDWQPGTPVNLERAVTPDKPLGGHLVSGHVDGRARLLERSADARSWRLRFEAPAGLARYIARKGSVTLDGVSLTVNEVEGACFGVNIVPHTCGHTTLGGLQPQQAVNLEVDLLARYLERLLAARDTEDT